MDLPAALIGSVLDKDGRFSSTLRARRIVEAIRSQELPASGILCAFDTAQFNYFAPNAGYPEASRIASEAAERLGCGLRWIAFGELIEAEGAGFPPEEETNRWGLSIFASTFEVLEEARREDEILLVFSEGPEAENARCLQPLRPGAFLIGHTDKSGGLPGAVDSPVYPVGLSAHEAVELSIECERLGIPAGGSVPETLRRTP